MAILRQVDRALEKINDNTYGVWISLEQDIPLAALMQCPMPRYSQGAREV